MLKRSAIAVTSLITAGVALHAQTFLLDRGLNSSGAVRVGTSSSNVFLTDDFKVGAAGEDWVIDKLRVWSVADSSAPFPQTPGNLYERITLRGGLSSAPTAKDECDCHGLLAIKTATLKAGSATTNTRDVVFSAVKYDDGSDFQESGRLSSMWEIEFQNLLWSVPGAARVQFGIVAVGRLNPADASKYAWFMHGSLGEPGHQLREYTNDGKTQGTTITNPSQMNIQVWGHLLAAISVRQTGKDLEVTLKSVAGLDTAKVDPASLRFGPHGAIPIATSRTSDRDGKAALVATFPATGVPQGSVNACLKGQREDGAPFEGCDLLPSSQSH